VLLTALLDKLLRSVSIVVNVLDRTEMRERKQVKRKKIKKRTEVRKLKKEGNNESCLRSTTSFHGNEGPTVVTIRRRDAFIYVYNPASG